MTIYFYKEIFAHFECAEQDCDATEVRSAVAELISKCGKPLRNGAARNRIQSVIFKEEGDPHVP